MRKKYQPKPYKIGGEIVGYRVYIRFTDRDEIQKYFRFSEYGGRTKAHKAACEYFESLKPLRDEYALLNPTGKIIGLGLYNDVREKYPNGRRILRLSLLKDGTPLRREWSLEVNDWELAFEEAIKLILEFRLIALTPELAQKIEKAKEHYNPYYRKNFND